MSVFPNSKPLSTQHEDPDNPSDPASGIGHSVCINHLWLVVAGGGGMSDFWKDYEPEPTRAAPMTTERALDLALEALEKLWLLGDQAGAIANPAITAIKQALAAPVQSCYCPNCEAMGKELAALKAQPAPAPGYCKHCKQYSIEEPLPAAQRQWVGLDWLPEHKCGLHLSHNEHRDVYETVEQFYDADDFISEEEWRKAIAEDSVWVLHWYPSTPVGFIRIAASTLETIEAKLKERNV
jgi:hypothetical protein